MEEEYLKRWRLILGGNEADGTGITLTPEEQRIDQSLEAVYDSDRRGGLGSSAPKVSRWLGDIREFFPQTVVQVIQRDAIKRLNITSLLTEKEMLETVVPDVHLVATLMSLSRVIPEKNNSMFEYLDLVNIMVYDFTGGWKSSKVAQHASMEHFRMAAKRWSEIRGVPKEKIILGVPFYGVHFVSAETLVGATHMPYKEILTNYPKNIPVRLLIW